jgi:large subunit ribosomal protein L17
MRHRISQKKLARDTDARKALLKNLANSLILQERIVTTKAKASSVRPFVEKLVTRSKTNDIASRRYLVAKLGLENSTKKLLEVIGPVFSSRPGGYTRITKLPPRMGDAAPMVALEFVDNISQVAVKEKLVQKESKSTEKPEKKKVTKPRATGAKKKVTTKKTK